MSNADSSPSPSPAEPSKTLEEALARLELAVPPEAAGRMAAYARLLWEWNEKLNLTRHTDWDRFAERDVLDALKLAPLLADGETVLDVGTGGGVPGVLLQILRPDLKVSLLDSVAKKMVAVEGIVKALELPVPVIRARLEEHLHQHSYDVLVFRAVAPLEKLLAWSKPHRQKWKRLLALKGPSWVEERLAAEDVGIAQWFSIVRRDRYPLPGTDSHSVILEITAAAVEPPKRDKGKGKYKGKS